MKLAPVQLYNYQNSRPIQIQKNVTPNNIDTQAEKQMQYSKVPAGFTYGANIHFGSGEFGKKRRIVSVPLIEFENYKTMPQARKERFRRLYREFHEILDESQMETMLKIDKHPEFMKLPLQTEREMDEFIKVAQMYSQYKEHPIICLGRSPKWFLNTSLFMRDGIPDYKFVAFSGRWFRIYDGDFGDYSGLVRLEQLAPTKAEEKAYKKYLRNIQADPISIIKRTQAAGKKTMITDYVDTGKGMTSFLDLMSRYAEEQGVLDEFGHSFDILTIGCNEYRERRKML
ncbi:hypothetical protein IJ579_08695 [bacterium]|nr:hypothetical protein [bacterium]